MCRIFRILAVLLVCSLATTPAGAQQMAATATGSTAAAAEESRKLPVRRVVLYKNGVGYFEHLGRVRGNQDVTIDFTSAQLNDVLKSLTTLDLGGGRIAGVSYNSDAPLQRRLGALRLPLGESTTTIQFLNALRGAQIEVRSAAGAFTGRLLSVEQKQRRTNEGQPYTAEEASLVSAAGEVRVMELGPGVSVRIVERELSTELGRYLDLVGSARAQDLRRMSIATSGSGERPLFVSYISEVPVWKTTYRIVLPSKMQAKPLLQGWAIVDNTVGEDWNDVQLSLVAGAPQSFIQQLSLPYYTSRPVVGLPQGVMLSPQTHMATLSGGAGSLTGNVTDPSGAIIAGAKVRAFDANNNLLAETITDEDGDYEFESLPAGSYRLEVDMQGFKKSEYRNVAVRAGGETENDVKLEVGDASSCVVVEAAPVVDTTASCYSAGVRRGGGIGEYRLNGLEAMGLVSAARDRMEAAAQARELGDLFEYKLKEPITIRKNQSAMVPIVHAEIAAEKVSLWNPGRGTARPLRALWLTNSSALTLDGGSFSVLEDETFAGEGLMEALKPGEARLLSYAVDLGTLVDTRADSERQRVTRARIIRGVLMHYSEERERKTYTIRNEDTAARTFVIEHPVRPLWKLAADAPKPAESSAEAHRFRITVEPKKTATLVITESKPIETTYQLLALDDTQIAVFLRQRSINPQMEQELRKIIAQRAVVAGFEAEARVRKEQIARIFEDQTRLRENIKALKGSTEEKALLLRYTRQLDEQETRLDTLRREVIELEQKKQAAQATLTQMASELTLDVTL